MNIDKSQYQTPNTIHSAEIYQQVEAHVAPPSPERLRAPFQLVDDLESLADSFRETAIAIEQRNGREVKMRFLPITFIRPARKQEDIQKELIDTERAIGGSLFAEKGKYHFWYGGKSYSTSNRNEVGNWYIEEISPKAPSSGTVTHIETHPNYINKFNHSGQLVPVTISDLDIFIPAAYHYVHAIMDAYPFEKDRAEVILGELDLPDDISALLPPEYANASQADYIRAA